MKKTAMVVFSYYPADPRVRREAEALIENGISVDVICLKKNDEARSEIFNNVTVHRINVNRKRAGKLAYIWEYATFIFYAFLKLSILHINKGFDIVHVHNMPDVLVFTGLIPRLMGTKIILDLHDPMPEVYVAKYSIKQSHPMIRFLILLEKWSIKFSHFVLTPNIAFRNLFISRGCPGQKISIVMNSPQETIFKNNSDETRFDVFYFASDGFNIMYHGTIVERHGLDTALKALSIIKKKIPYLKFHVFGDGDFVDRFQHFVNELQLNEYVQYYGHVSLETIAAAIRSIDLGIIPNKRNPFTEINMPTRIFEYLSICKPVIAPKTKGITDYFDEESIYFFEPEDENKLADVILKCYSDFRSNNKETLERGIAIYKKHDWKSEKTHFINLVSNLLPTL